MAFFLNTINNNILVLLFVQQPIFSKHQNLDIKINFITHCHGMVIDNDHSEHQTNDDLEDAIHTHFLIVYDTSNTCRTINVACDVVN